MRIGGFQKFSLIDFPKKSSAVIFTQGCNFRCSYCHNPELVYENLFGVPVREEEVFAFLEQRKNILDGVVITGGEPTLQPDLADFILKIKSKGYFVKLDTNGSNPDIISRLLNKRLLDFIAMDIKAPLDKYKSVCGVKINIQNIRKSIEIIKKSNIPFEFRTTYDMSKLIEYDIQRIKEETAAGYNYRLQKCNNLSLKYDKN